MPWSIQGKDQCEYIMDSWGIMSFERMTICDVKVEMQVIKSGEKTESTSMQIKDYKKMVLPTDNDNILTEDALVYPGQRSM